MIERSPPGLVLWPEADLAPHQVAVLISDVHCTDGTVGNQSADEADWETFFRELSAMVAGRKVDGQPMDVIFILNGDIVDLLRSSRWVERGVYPWDRDHPAFLSVLREVMAGIVEKHGGARRAGASSGFFGYLKAIPKQLGEGVKLHFVPVLGNHDKEMQLDVEVRRMFYQECLGLTPQDFGPAYRQWVSAQLGLADASLWPLLPVYFASPGLKLLATHGQWRDDTNRGPQGFSAFGSGWQPKRWQKDGYRGFTAPCFGDTLATGLLSHFIYHAREAIAGVFPGSPGEPLPDSVTHILNILAEMDLYRPSALGVVRLLEESAKLEARGEGAQLQKLVIRQFSDSLASWLAFPATCQTAPPRFKAYLPVLGWLGKLGFNWINVRLMRLLAWLSDNSDDPDPKKHATLPAFMEPYRRLGFRLHVEGHTHTALETDLHFASPAENRNYAYINLGAWRDRIVPKLDRGYRRRSIGRALVVESRLPEQRHSYTLRDITSWGSHLDTW